MSRATAVIAALLRAGRGRLLPGLLLGVGALLLSNIERTPLHALQLNQFDLYQRLLPRELPSEPMIIVGIDSQSLLAHGQWPWPRDLLGRLLARVQAGEPLAVGFDFIFAEADQHAPALLARRLPGIDPGLLERLPDPDQQFAEVIGRAPTVLATVGLPQALAGARLDRKSVV